MRVLPLVVLAVACTPTKEDTGHPAVCHGGTAWVPGAVAFRDATAAWGLVRSPTSTARSATTPATGAATEASPAVRASWSRLAWRARRWATDAS